MRIRIDGPIKGEEERQIDQIWYGIESGLSFKTLDEALASKKPDDKEITLEFHCPGGSVVEGYAMYDKLRSMEGCVIRAEVIGECSSMATVILLAASERKAYRDARICIHKPRIQCYFNESLTEDEAQKVYDDLHSETQRMLDIYVDRTGAERETLEALMKEDRYISVDEAKELGFITDIIEHKTAQKFNPLKSQKMAEKKNNEPSAIAKAFKALGAALGITDAAEEENKVVSITLNTADGGTIEVDRESGDPQVGDPASPDGEFKMPGGKTIVIENGVITEIREDSEDNGNGEEGNDNAQESNKKIEELESRIKELEDQLKEAKKSEKTLAEKEILNLVSIGGGVEWLKSAKSNYKAPERNADRKGIDNNEMKSESEVSKMLEDIKKNKTNN